MKRIYLAMILVIVLNVPFAHAVGPLIGVLAGTALETLRQTVVTTAADSLSQFMSENSSAQELAQLTQHLHTVEAQLQAHRQSAGDSAELRQLQDMLNSVNNLITRLSERMDNFEQRISGQAGQIARLGEQLRLQQAVPASTASTGDLNFKLNYLYRDQGQGAPRPLTQGAVLRSNDTYKIIITPAENSYVYLFQQDTAGQIERLFPMQAFGGHTLNNTNPMQGGQTYHLPTATQSFRLDDKTGTETLYFFASRHADAVLESFYTALQRLKQNNKPKLYDAVQAEFTQTLSIQSKGMTHTLAEDPTETTTMNTDQQSYSVKTFKLQDVCRDCRVVLTFEHR